MGFLKIAVILFMFLFRSNFVDVFFGAWIASIGVILLLKNKSKTSAASSYNSSVNGSGTALGLGPPAPLNLTNGTKVTKKAANPNVIINVS